MKKITLVITFLFLGTFICAQTLQVDYDLEVNYKNTLATIKSDFRLELSSEKSLFYPLVQKPEELLYYDKGIQGEYRKEDFASVIMPNGDQLFPQITKFYKDYSSNKIFFNRLVANNQVYLKESLDSLFDWQLNSVETDTILNYPCKSAKMAFRGRDYTAYYTTELGLAGGPWKFDGLPGLILKIESDDGYFKINATGIKESNESVPENPYKEIDEFLSFKEHGESIKDFWLNKFKKLSAKWKDDEGGVVEMNFDDNIEDFGLGTIVYEY